MSGSFKLEQFIKIVSTDNHIFHFKPIGFFSKEAALVLKNEFLALNKNIIDSYGGRPFVVIADMSESSIPSDEAKIFMLESMKYAYQNGLVGSIEVYKSTIAKMSATRMHKQTERGMNKIDRFIVGSLSEALAKADEILCEPA